MSDSTSEMVKAMIQTQIVAALNSAPEMINKLVQAALSKPIDPKTGRQPEYSHNASLPYLDFIVGEEIRTAARAAVIKIVKESEARVEEQVRKALEGADIVSAVTKAFVKSVDEGWRINMNFEVDKSSR